MGSAQSSNNNNNNEIDNEIVNLKENYETLEELAEELKNDNFKQYLCQLWKTKDEEKKKQEISKLSTWILQNKEKFSIEQSSVQLAQLKAEIMSLSLGPNDHNEKEEKIRQVLIEVAKYREENKDIYKLFERTFGKIERLAAPFFNRVATSGGRSNRAKRSNLVSAHAGNTKIEGAKADKFGNAIGSEFDLGVDGAFHDFKIIVFQLSSFTQEYYKRAFEKKGFQFEIYISTKDLSPQKFREIVFGKSVCQVWVISSARDHITTAQVDILVDFHKSGKSLYIWGDNFPLIDDANKLLKGLFPKNKIEMTGNVFGCNVVKETHSYDVYAKNNTGFLAHMITTGLVHLFEGHSVASFNLEAILAGGFTPLLFGSEFNLITIVRPADGEGGAIIADGAFTRLYYNVDEAGSIRYIINAACWLALESLSSGSNPFEDGEDEEQVEEEEYDCEGAYSEGICSILYTPEPIIYIPILSLPDPDVNTSDVILDDPLGFGELNYRILGRNLYGEKAGKVVMEFGKDPYQRTTISGILPAVSLSKKKNLQLFTDELCRVYLGRRNLRSAAQMLFVSSLDSILHPDRLINLDEQTRNVYKYLLNQAFDHFLTTPDFTQLGDKVPLINAMFSYFTVSPILTQISKSFSTVSLIARTLLKRKMLSSYQLTRIVRRSFIKLLINSALKKVKNSKEGEVDGNLDFRKLITQSLFTTWNGIPTVNSGRLMEELPSFFPHIAHSLTRYENYAQVKISINAINTLVLHLLTLVDLRSYRVEALIQHLQSHALFTKFWIDGEVPSDERVIELLNSQFASLSNYDKEHAPYVPFETIFGASCFSCHCGFSFGDIEKEELTNEYIEKVKTVRNKHFKEIYKSDENGYPTVTSSFYSLHRVTFNIMKSLFPNDLDKKEEMVSEIAKTLLYIGKGNIYVPDTENEINYSIDSFLIQRKKVVEIPEFIISFADRARFEHAMYHKK